MASVDPALFKGLNYRLVGPSRGGRVTTVTGVPSQPKHVLHGRRQRRRVPDDGRRRDLDADHRRQGAARLDGSHRGRRFGSEHHLSRHRIGRRAQQRVDRPRHLQVDRRRQDVEVRRPLQRRPDRRRPHPSDQSRHRLGRGVRATSFKANAERGVFKTTDGGQDLEEGRCSLSDSVGAMDVELQPGNPNVVYAWMSRLERKPWTIISGRTEGGFYKSTDGGEHFTKIIDRPARRADRQGATSPSRRPSPIAIYALVEAKPGGGLYRSDDAGQTWALMNSQASLIQRPFYYTTLGADPTNADVVYAGAEGFYKSTDGGKTFTTMRTPHGDNHDIWINPKDGNTMIQANDGGANVSIDGGRTWSTQMNQPTAEIYGVWVDNAVPVQALRRAAGQHARSSCRARPIRTTSPTGAAGPAARPGRSCRIRQNPEIVYGSCKGQYGVMNLKTGQEKSYWIGAQSLYGNSGQRSDPALPARLADGDLAARSGRALLRLAVSASHARQGRDVGEDLAGSHGESGRAARARAASRSRATSRAKSSTARSTRSRESPLEKGVIWTGSNDGPFHVTRDNGKTWTNVTPKDLPSRRTRAVHRPVAASPGLGVLRGVSLSARRLRAVHLQDRRLRQDVDSG